MIIQAVASICVALVASMCFGGMCDIVAHFLAHHLTQADNHHNYQLHVHEAVCLIT